MIQSYDFGSIMIDGKSYRHDVQVTPGHVAGWRRAESHNFSPNEFRKVIDSGICGGEWPEAVIIGNGYDGIMKVDPGVIEAIRAQGIEVMVNKTGQAKDEYNKFEQQGKKVLGLFHLTC
jgi:hypothetical protein